MTAPWCVVANVRRVTTHGEAHTLEAGTKHFAPGAKVRLGYVYHGGPRVEVFGRHRGGMRIVSMQIHPRHLTNFRAKQEHNPAWAERVYDIGETEARALAAKLAAEYPDVCHHDECATVPGMAADCARSKP